tara:strand:- start:55 stop:564 length:510 start_codon:yes stop_codon:yes gene_type:complete
LVKEFLNLPDGRAATIQGAVKNTTLLSEIESLIDSTQTQNEEEEETEMNEAGEEEMEQARGEEMNPTGEEMAQAGEEEVELTGGNETDQAVGKEMGQTGGEEMGQEGEDQEEEEAQTESESIEDEGVSSQATPQAKTRKRTVRSHNSSTPKRRRTEAEILQTESARLHR